MDTNITLLKSKRVGNSIITQNAVATYTFSNALNGMLNSYYTLGHDPNEWLLIYFGIGPTVNSHTRYSVGVYTYQPSAGLDYSMGTEQGDDFTSVYPSSGHYNMTLGPGLDGYLSNIYITANYLKLPSVFRQNGDTKYSTRGVCYDTIQEYEPFCIGIEGCGNGIVDTIGGVTEECDDGNLNNGDRCSSTCTLEPRSEGNIHTTFLYSYCNDKGGNGRWQTDLDADETCDDKNRDNGDGGDSDCKKEVGYTFVESPDTQTVATPICGDLMRVPREHGDDNDINDGIGCKADCSGPLQGWTCSSANPSVCTFTLMDGIRAINGEEGDDGNAIDSDGCSNSGIIDPRYSCADGILGNSVCRLKGGNGFLDDPTEQCDDADNLSGDGGSNDCKLEYMYGCSGGSSTSKDVGIKGMTITLESISTDNTATISFSSYVQPFNVTTDDLKVVITGPASSYRLSYTASFNIDNRLNVYVTAIDIVFGNNNEDMTITLDRAKFISTLGEQIYKNSVVGHPYQVVTGSSAISAAGTATTSILGLTMGLIIASNILL